MGIPRVRRHTRSSRSQMDTRLSLEPTARTLPPGATSAQKQLPVCAFGRGGPRGGVQGEGLRSSSECLPCPSLASSVPFLFPLRHHLYALDDPSRRAVSLGSEHVKSAELRRQEQEATVRRKAKLLHLWKRWDDFGSKKEEGRRKEEGMNKEQRERRLK